MTAEASSIVLPIVGSAGDLHPKPFGVLWEWGSALLGVSSSRAA